MYSRCGWWWYYTVWTSTINRRHRIYNGKRWKLLPYRLVLINFFEELCLLAGYTHSRPAMHTVAILAEVNLGPISLFTLPPFTNSQQEAEQQQHHCQPPTIIKPILKMSTNPPPPLLLSVHYILPCIVYFTVCNSWITIIIIISSSHHRSFFSMINHWMWVCVILFLTDHLCVVK